jgi:isoleucyl-tRNA synthetase
LHGTIAEVRERMDAYDAMGSARVLGELIDDLSNWYVRRGRRRYWKAEDDADKTAAYWTLYEALVTMAGLLAPFIPFTAEAIYLNLAAPYASGGAAVSVHLTDYPVADARARDLELETEMAACRRLVSLGRAARNRTQIRTRQPLPVVVVSGAKMSPEVEALFAEEINVKRVEYDEEPGRYLQYLVKPNYERVGPRFGRLTPDIGGALTAADGAAVARQVASGAKVTLQLGRGQEEVTLDPEDIVVRTEEREGFAVEREGQLQVALSTAVSEELLLEGLARELVNRVQRMRKDAGFDVSDRVEATIAATGDLLKATQAHRDHIAREILATRLEVVAACEAPSGETRGYRQELEVEGDPLTVVLRRLR